MAKMFVIVIFIWNCKIGFQEKQLELRNMLGMAQFNFILHSLSIDLKILKNPTQLEDLQMWRRFWK